MAEIFVCGHRNPDMDSICAAYSYAFLKNKIDPNNTFYPVRCGNLNDTTKAQFDRLGVTPPPFIKDVRTKVLSVTRNTEAVVQVEILYITWSLSMVLQANHQSYRLWKGISIVVF